MQRTPNLNLPQFEPSDKYLLEDYNQAYMTLDTKIKEAQDLIATWTTFKNTGGTFGGNITISPTYDLFLGNPSKNANGYTKLPNGMIMQWGTIDFSIDKNSFRVYDIKMPIPFPNIGLFSTVNINRNVSSNTTDYTDVISKTCSLTYGVVAGATKQDLRIVGKDIFNQLAATTTFQFTWLAIGY